MPESVRIRSTPLNLLGLGALLILRRSSRSHPAGEGREATTVYLCVTYVIFNVAMMTLGAKKQDRYLLPVFPVLDLLAGLGLVRLWQLVSSQWPKSDRVKPGQDCHRENLQLWATGCRYRHRTGGLRPGAFSVLPQLL